MRSEGASRVRIASSSSIARGSTLSADFLVISLGAQLDPQSVPGLPEAGHNFYTLAGAEGLWDDLQGFRAGRLVVLTAAPAYKCPAASYEAAMLLDAFCRHRRIRHALNQLLAEMDGFDPRKGIVVMSATNRPEVLDPALLRQGRFDRRVVVDRPDVKGREAILRLHARAVKLATDVDLAVVAARTTGFAGRAASTLFSRTPS